MFWYGWIPAQRTYCICLYVREVCDVYVVAHEAYYTGQQRASQRRLTKEEREKMKVEKRRRESEELKIEQRLAAFGVDYKSSTSTYALRYALSNHGPLIDVVVIVVFGWQSRRPQR